MELLNCLVSKFIPVIQQIAVWSVWKITFASGNLAIAGKGKDSNNFRELFPVKIV
jgi:hypothetical protein